MSYTVEQFEHDLAEPYAWPGGYPRYFVTYDGEALSFEAARDHRDLIVSAIRDGICDGWNVVGCEINWEDPTLYCAHSGERIESAYAED